MFSNYLKIALRGLLKNKLHTAINVAGLAMGIASVFLISIYIQYETSYDAFYPQSENLYRITWEDDNPQTRTPHPMAQALAADFPEVESAVSLSPLWAAGLTREIFSVRNLEKDLKFDEANILAVDSTFFDVFGFPVVRGDARRALKSINGMLISESTAKKYFGDADPIGKQLAVNSDTALLEVMAVFKDVPAQAHFHFDFLISYVREKSFDPDDEYYTWADFGHYNYVRLKTGTDPKAFEAKLMGWAKQYIDISDEDFRQAVANNIGFNVQPVSDIHLKSHLRWELESNGNIEYVYIMGAAALLTLLIACINFMNLMTSKSVERAKEIGIRKTLGALRQQLSMQFLGESVLVTMIALVFAVLMAELCLPVYSVLSGTTLTLNYLQALPILLILAVIIGLGSGIYPSLFLSAIQPQAILKGKFQSSNQGSRLRNGLIVFQFAISMTLISGAVIIFNQLEFIRNKNLGFNKEEVLVIPLKDRQLSTRMNGLKSELLRLDGVQSVSATSNMPGGQFNQNPVYALDHPEDDVSFSEVIVDYDFLKTMNIELVQGRFFLPENRADSLLAFVINETGAKQLFLDEPIGKEIRWEAYGRGLKGKIIGVVKDFHFQSFHDPIRPLIFVPYPAYNHLVIRLKTENLEQSLAQIKNVYAQFDDHFEFEFSFLDDRLDKQYASEERTAVIFTAFAVIAIAIACFGLFAMAVLSFSQRTKEVSVRKVLGASVKDLMILLLTGYTKLIIVSIVLATPIAWWMMDQWLDNFIYQVGVQPLVFVGSGLSLVAIAWITLGYFTLKTSRVNPAETLKSE
jgi:putative ABC transport system permease protein